MRTFPTVQTFHSSQDATRKLHSNHACLCVLQSTRDFQRLVENNRIEIFNFETVDLRPLNTVDASRSFFAAVGGMPMGITWNNDLWRFCSTADERNFDSNMFRLHQISILRFSKVHRLLDLKYFKVAPHHYLGFISSIAATFPSMQKIQIFDNANCIRLLQDIVKHGAPHSA